jgi:hypothetical protein
MNNTSYKVLKYLDRKGNGEERDFSTYIDELYKKYIKSVEIFDINSAISKEEFYKIFYTIFDVLSLRGATIDNINHQCEMYLYNIVYDSIQDNVNLKWFIDKMWYLSVGSRDDINKYRDSIPFIQKRLLKELNINDTMSEKIDRKIYTMILIK